MLERPIEDRLREEYLTLLPEIRLVADELETQGNHCLLPIKRKLRAYEQVVVGSRIKECESAIDALQRRQQWKTFDPNRASEYSLTQLKDLAGVQVLVFPRSRLGEVNKALLQRFPNWESDRITLTDPEDKTKRVLAEKYQGFCQASRRVCGEYQIVPMLLGLFWRVEHDVIYKPSPELRGIEPATEMKERIFAVYAALERFETAFDTMVQEGRDRRRHT